MDHLHRLLALIPLLMVLHGAARADDAPADPCAGFRWDVTRERALFATDVVPTELAAGRDPAAAPELLEGRAYHLALALASEVTFVASPGRAARGPDERGGVARFHAGPAARYRIALDGNAWVDVVVTGRRLPTQDFGGRPGCAAPHKLVIYELGPGQDVVVQISGTSAPAVRLSITLPPAAADLAGAGDGR